eukprot:2507671-Amphidinium_carterae.1
MCATKAKARKVSVTRSLVAPLSSASGFSAVESLDDHHYCPAEPSEDCALDRSFIAKNLERMLAYEAAEWTEDLAFVD